MSLNNRNDFISDSLERLGTEDPCLGNEKTLVRCEEFGWPSIADESKTATLEIIVRKFHRTSVRMRLARGLTENPVAALRPREHDRRTALGLRLDCDKSENGNGTGTTEPAVGVTMRRPPRGGSSRRTAPGEAREKLRCGLVQPRLALRSGQGKSSPKASNPRHDSKGA